MNRPINTDIPPDSGPDQKDTNQQLRQQLAAEQERATQLAEELQRERELLEAMIENAPAQLAYLDTAFNYVRVNTAYAEALGKTAEWLIGHNHFDLFADANTRRIFEEVRDTGKAAMLNASPLGVPERPEQETSYWDGSLAAVTDDRDRVVGLVLAVLDVTVVQRAQAQLHRQVHEHAQQLERRVISRTAALQISEARFRAVFEDAPMGIALLDHEERIIQSNMALDRILGVTEKTLRGHPLSSFLTPEDGATQAKRYAALMNGESDSYRAVVRFEGPAHKVPADLGGNRPIWCNITISLVRDVEHEPRLAVAMIEDITEQHQAQAAMVQNEKLALTGQLAASFAHEINNPLQTVIGCLGLADESVSENASVRVYLKMASEELKRAAGIVGRLRDLNRPSQPEDRQLHPLEELVTHALMITEKQCYDRGIDVEVDYRKGENTLVNVIPDRIHQVFLNLILNAIDAMPDGGKLSVTVEATAPPAGGRVIFRDTGSGIPPEIQARLFDPFQTSKPEGLGLGLFISQNIVQEHGGQIQVKSLPGEGTTFTVWLPA